MNLAEMLEYTAAQFLDDRTALVEGDGDNLWSDEFLVTQFNRAQKILARRAWVIQEIGSSQGTSAASLVTLKTGVSFYPLHRSVLRVYDATPSTQSMPLGRSEGINLRDTNYLTRRPDDAFDAFETGEWAARAGNTLLPGTPLAISTDDATRTLRVFPPPTSDQNGLKLYLKIARYPITWLSLDDTDAVPEVPEAWHEELCEYAAGKALTLPNVDSDQKAEGRRLLEAFDDVVKEARRMRQRAEMGPARWNFSSTTAMLR